jgi:hypothetical protein
MAIQGEVTEQNISQLMNSAKQIAAAKEKLLLQRHETGRSLMDQNRGGRRSNQAEVCKCRQVVVGRGRGKAAEHDMANAAVRSTKLRDNRADGDARGPIGRESINAGRYRRKGNRSEAVCRCQIKSGAIARREQVLLATMSSAPDRADGMDDVLGG